jgi:hypothetical protein
MVPMFHIDKFVWFPEQYTKTVRSESRCALKATVRRSGCQYRGCRCSVLLFDCIQLLNSG